MTRLYIVEQSGLEPGGHYQAYASCVIDGARRLGLEPVVLANKRLRAKSGTLPPDIIPCFTYTWSEAERDGKLGWEDGNLAYEIFEAFRRVPPTPDDHVFLHTAGYRELRALLDCLTSKMPGDPLPYFHLLLRYDPDVLIERFRDYAEYLERIAASPYLQQKIRLHTDTHLLSAAFADVCRLPFATAPIPFDQSLLRASLAARPPRQAGDPLTIVYLGDARDEKGYQHLPQALSYLWKGYVEPGRVRFVLQSNFNTPGGEPGILSASQNLAAFLSTTLKSEPLQPDEYYQILADADVVLIPYSPLRYRYRSSGVLVEAMGAGKVVVTSAGSWMASQVTPDHAVLFETPAGLGPAIAEAVDRFDTLSAGAEARRAETLARATGESLVRHLLAAAEPAPARARAQHRRILLIMNGDAMALSNGASRIAHAQLQYLAAAGYDIVGLFLTYDAPSDSEAFTRWRARLGRSIAPFPFERVFVAGPGGRDFEPDQSPAVRHQRQHSGAALKAEFEFVAGFEFGGKLLQFLRTHPVDAVLLNYITNYPVVESLGLDGLPVICEMHDLQSFQRAIYGQRLVDPDDLDEEFKWLSRCAALVSLNPRETAIARERLPDAVIETSGVFLPTPPPALGSLAGAKDLAEIVSSSGPLLPEYQFEAAWETGRIDGVQRLIEAVSVDLLFVSSAHMANVSGLKWFLSEVFEPYLAQHQLTMIVAGSICRVGGWPEHRRLLFIDQVEDLAPLYAAARIVVLPITEGAGSPIKTFEALAYGRPIVGTSHAFRGVDGEPGEFIVRDDPWEFAEAILELSQSLDERKEAAERSRRAAARLNDFARYFAIMDGVFARVLPGARTPTPPPAAPAQHLPYVEWPSALQALNRMVRSCLDGEVLEGWALDQLIDEDEEEVESLLDRVTRSLLDQRDAAVLRTEQRLKRYLADPLGARLREDTMFAVRLAVAGRRGSPIATGPAADGIRVVTHGGLALTVALSIEEAAGSGETDGGRSSLLINGRSVPAKRVAGARRVGDVPVLQADIPPLPGSKFGLRTLELGLPAPGSTQRAGILRHAIPLTAGARLLQRDVLGGGFEPSGDARGADLRPGEIGRLWLPRIIDGRNEGYVDLCFARVEADQGALAGPALSVMLDNRPAETEFIGRGALTIVRVFLGVHAEFGDFGVATLIVVNRVGHQPLRLIAAYSGLLLGSREEAAEVAAVLPSAGQRLGQASHPQLATFGREAVASIIRGIAPGVAALDALCTLMASGAGQDTLRGLVSRELSRASRLNGSANGGAGDADMISAAETVIEDVAAIVGTVQGTPVGATALLSPALPFEIVDGAGNTLPDRTEAALRERAGSWRLPMPSDADGARIKIDIGAMLELPGHPGVIESNNFHPAESPDAQYRWTGPGPTPTITIPVVLNRPARLVIELGPTGKNTAAGDFTIACNGKAVAHTLERREDSATLSAELPAARPAAPATVIALTLRHTFQQPPDRRVLGVVFRSLSLFLGPPDRPAAQPQPQPQPARARRQRARPASRPAAASELAAGDE